METLVFKPTIEQCVSFRRVNRRHSREMTITEAPSSSCNASCVNGNGVSITYCKRTCSRIDN